MKLYHFTSHIHVRGCLDTGIRLGTIPTFSESGEVTLLPGYQWLTKNPSFSQRWDEYSSLPYKRTGYRIGVSIPYNKRIRKHLIPWMVFCQNGLVHPQMIRDLNGDGDPEEWYIYTGPIPKRLLREVVKNPEGISRKSHGKTHTTLRSYLSPG